MNTVGVAGLGLPRVIVTRSAPVPPPIKMVTMEMSEEDAILLVTLVGNVPCINRNVGPGVMRIYKALRNAGIASTARYYFQIDVAD